MSEYFKFENSTRDIPFYKHNPRLSKTAWIVLLLSVPLAMLVAGISIEYSEFSSEVLFCLVMLIPLLYYCKWDYSLIFSRLTRSDIKLAVFLCIGYLIYALAVGEVLDFVIGMPSSTGSSLSVTLETFAGLIFSMMAEEVLKFIPLMFFMRLIYKFSENRKLSIVISSAVIMICFGLLHYTPGDPVIYVLLIQGFGTIFELYGYFKTKNLFVPYLSHLFTDGIIFLIALL